MVFATRIVPLPPAGSFQILIISPVAKMQSEFANTLVIEKGSDEAGRIRGVE
jgi:hypothetical protein